MDKAIKQVGTELMQKAIEHMNHELASIRTGRASAALLDSVKVNYYGSQMPLKQVAAVSIPDPKTITIQPFQANMLGVIEKAILASGLGLTPNNDGRIIRLTIPQLSEERRKELLRVVRKFGEDTKIAIRNIRRDMIEKLRQAEKDDKITEDDLHHSEKEAQEITDQHIAKVDTSITVKEQEVMTV